MPSAAARPRRLRSPTPCWATALLRDGAGWPEWSPIDLFELERPGADEPEGLGAVRVFRVGHVTGRDEIVELIPLDGFVSELTHGLAQRASAVADARSDAA